MLFRMTFLYFCYGSNLLSKRMLLNCPSAKPKCFAELKKYRLEFIGYANSWKGACATIIEDDSNSVWGVVWEISKDHEEALTRQESLYKEISVTVHKDNEQLRCKTFQRTLSDEGQGSEGLKICKPSAIYKAVCVQGAKEHKLPEFYIQKLEAIEDNGYKGKVDIQVDIKL